MDDGSAIKRKPDGFVPQNTQCPCKKAPSPTHTIATVHMEIQYTRVFLWRPFLVHGFQYKYCQCQCLGVGPPTYNRNTQRKKGFPSTLKAERRDNQTDKNRHDNRTNKTNMLCMCVCVYVHVYVCVCMCVCICVCMCVCVCVCVCVCA